MYNQVLDSSPLEILFEGVGGGNRDISSTEIHIDIPVQPIFPAFFVNILSILSLGYHSPGLDHMGHNAFVECCFVLGFDVIEIDSECLR